MAQALMTLPRQTQDVPRVLLQVAGHVRRPPVSRKRAPLGDPRLAAVIALTNGLRAGKAHIDRLRQEGKEALAKAKAERRAETRTKLVAFGLFDLMAACLVYTMWAGIQG